MSVEIMSGNGINLYSFNSLNYLFIQKVLKANIYLNWNKLIEDLVKKMFKWNAHT